MQHFRTILAGSLFALAVLFVPAFGASAITISPPFYETTLDPGNTEFGAIKLFNEDTQPITLYPVAQNFTYKEGDEEGTPDFYPATEDPMGQAMASWLVFDKQPIVIEPNGRASLQYAINVPSERVQPGGHYGAIIFSTQPPTPQGGTVGVGQQIASLIFVRIGGDLKEVGSIAEFGFKQKKLSYNHLPVDFFVRFENAGNVHLRPTGNLFIKSWYGRQVASIRVNDGFASTLPNSIRRYEFGWHKGGPTAENPGFIQGLNDEWNNFAIGTYKAQLVLTYGSQNQVVVEEREFTVWPWRLMVVGGLCALIVLVVLVLMMKSYNKSVIRRYERSRQ